MNNKEITDFGHDFISFLQIAKDSNSPEEVSNLSIDLIKEILKRYPPIRYEFFLWNKEDLLTDLGLDYGKPKNL
jgi:hypothetical protein